MENQIILLALISLATSAISLTLTKAQIFAWPRKVIKKRSAFFGELFSCPYCTSHWLSFVFVIVYRNTISLFGIPVVDSIVFMFSVVALASVFSGLIYKSIASIGADDEEES